MKIFHSKMSMCKYATVDQYLRLFTGVALWLSTGVVPLHDPTAAGQAD